MRKDLLVAVLLLATPAAAIPPLPPPPPPTPPINLQIAIHIDGLTAELLREYRPQLTGGLARLTSAAPATLITPTGGGQSITVSGEGGRSFTQGGTIPIQQFAWNGSAFAMSTPAAAAVPRSMTALNAAIRKLVATAEPALVPPPYCLTKQGSGRFARAAGDYAAYVRSPSLDGATLALSAGLIQELRLGRDAAPDLLEISLPVTARVAGTYGAASEESCLQLFALDRDLGDFLRAVDRMSVPYEVTLTSFPPAS